MACQEDPIPLLAGAEDGSLPLGVFIGKLGICGTPMAFGCARNGVPGTLVPPVPVPGPALVPAENTSESSSRVGDLLIASLMSQSVSTDTADNLSLDRISTLYYRE